MTNKRIYNFFLFMSTLTRSLVSVFSVIFLYDKGYRVNDILLFLLIMYSVGIVVNYFSLVINYKIILILSIILYGVSYLYLSIMNNSIFNLVIFSIVFSMGSYSYHAIRHYLGICMIDYDRGNNINKLLIIMYGSVILANLFGIILIEKLPMIVTAIVIMVMSLVSVVPILKLEDIESDEIKLKSVRIPRRKFIFNILEQFKVIFMEIQPLYLYIFVKNSKYYVGIFNVVINVASLLVIIFILSKVKRKYFKYINILLGIVLYFKLNIYNSVLLLGIAFLEGVLIKVFEKFSLDNLYNINNNQVRSYLVFEEFIFFISKSLIMFVFFCFIKDLKLILYICIIGIVLSGFYIKDKD